MMSPSTLSGRAASDPPPAVESARVDPEVSRLGEADTQNDTGARLLSRGKAEEAAGCFLKAIALDPGFAEAYFNLALAYNALRFPARAIQCLSRARNLKPGFFQASFVLGNVLLDEGDFDAALCYYREAAAMAPDFAEAHYNMGHAAKATGDFETAAGCYARALEIRPDYAEALNNYGWVQMRQGRLEQAADGFQRALALKPRLAEAHYNLGLCLQLAGDHDSALARFRSALECDPDYAPARWLYRLSLPILYGSEEELAERRRRFERELEGLVGGTPLRTEVDVQRALAGIDSTTNFFLAYQGLDDRRLQEAYGRFVCRVLQARFPQWATSRPLAPPAGAERIRVGYVSSFMHSHTVGQYLLGWLQAHDRSRFQTSCYHIGPRTDSLTDQLRRHADVFHHVPGQLKKAAERIAADRLHILVFFDIGMETLTTQLAALRLAPVQCATWGHPVTSGLPTIDYFLSSDLMEPPDGASHYSETLVRLPNLALNFPRPQLPANPKTRRELGLNPEAVVYLSSQSLFKYLPRHDDIYPRIAAEVPNAQFVFLANPQKGITRRFEERLAAAFSARGLSSGDFCRIQPRLGRDDFFSLNLAADVLLDSLEWSGGRTTLEAVAGGLPVVTLPGRFMRGRHSYAMLRLMGITDTLAVDKDDYVRIAAVLGRDPEALGRLKFLFQKRSQRLYDERTFMWALEAFYRRVADGSLPTGAGFHGTDAP